MAEDRAEVFMGAVVLAAAFGFLVYAASGTGYGPQPDRYVLKASFRSVEGITPGSDVRLAGVKVGSIESLVLNPVTYFADASIMIDKDVVLPDDSAILISSEGLLGGNFVELVPGGSSENFVSGDEIEDTQGAVSIISLMMKFASGGSEAEPTP